MNRQSQNLRTFPFAKQSKSAETEHRYRGGFRDTGDPEIVKAHVIAKGLLPRAGDFEGHDFICVAGKTHEVEIVGIEVVSIYRSERADSLFPAQKRNILVIRCFQAHKYRLIHRRQEKVR